MLRSFTEGHQLLTPNKFQLICKQCLHSRHLAGSFRQLTLSLWGQAMQMAWIPWLGVVSALISPGGVASAPLKLSPKNKESSLQERSQA